MRKGRRRVVGMGGKKEGKEKNRKEEEKICGKGAKEERGW